MQKEPTHYANWNRTSQNLSWTTIAFSKSATYRPSQSTGLSLKKCKSRKWPIIKATNKEVIKADLSEVEGAHFEVVEDAVAVGAVAATTKIAASKGTLSGETIEPDEDRAGDE